MKLVNIVLGLVLVTAGCSTLTSTQTETETVMGTNIVTTRTTRLRVSTFWDGKTELSKLRSSTTDKTQGLTVGGLAESAGGTNSVEVLKAIGGILQAVK